MGTYSLQPPMLDLATHCLAEDRVLGLGRKQESFRGDAKQELLQTKLDLGPLLKDYRVEDGDGNPTRSPVQTNNEIFK